MQTAIRGVVLALTAAMLAAVMSDCGSSGAERSAPQSHLAVVVMENKEYGQVIGNPRAPYEDVLGDRYALATRYHAITHPSLPNYLALIGGSTFGTRRNSRAHPVRASNLVDQLEGAGVSWKAYMEGLPRPCYRAEHAGKYAKRHDPFLYFEDIARRPRRCARVVPYRQLATDLARGGLPRFVWITPDLCHDTHSCGVGTGDRFLAELMQSLLPRLGPHGALFVVWDEGEGSSRRGCCRLAHGGRTPAIVVGPEVRPGFRLRTPVDHYSTLRTIEDAFGLERLRGAACRCTPTLDPLFRRPPRVR